MEHLKVLADTLREQDPQSTGILVATSVVAIVAIRYLTKSEEKGDVAILRHPVSSSFSPLQCRPRNSYSDDSQMPIGSGVTSYELGILPTFRCTETSPRSSDSRMPSRQHSTYAPNLHCWAPNLTLHAFMFISTPIS